MRSPRFLITVSLSILLSFALGVLKTHYVPKLEKMVLQEIDKYNESNPVALVKPAGLRVTLFPPGVELVNTEITPRLPLSKSLGPTSIEKIGAYVNVISLFTKKYKLNQLKFYGAMISIFVDKSDPNTSKKFELPIKDLSFLTKIPVNDLTIEKIDLLGQVNATELSFKANNLFLNIENNQDSAEIHLRSDKFQFKENKSKAIIDVNLQSRISLKDQLVAIRPIKIKNQKSSLNITGEINGPWMKGDYQKINLNLDGDLKLTNLVSLIQNLTNKDIPKVTGYGRLRAELNLVKNENPDIQIKTNLKQLSVDDFNIGELVLDSKYKNGIANFTEFKIFNPGGKLKLKKAKIIKDTKNNFNFSTFATLDEFELKEFLSQIKLKDMPVQLKLTAGLPCSGRIYPNFTATCTGAIEGSDLKVDVSDTNIVTARQLGAEGKVTVDMKQVKYDAQISVMNSKGTSKGVISYKKGFNIDFDGDIAEFSEVENLVNLKFEGQSKLKGNTRGTSDWATVQIKFTNENFWFEDWRLGQNDMDLTYKKGILGVVYDGIYEQTKYSGNFNLNFGNDQIYVIGRIPSLSAIDLQDIIARKLTYPVKFSGTGSAQVKVWGPLDLAQLNMDIQTEFMNGSIADETFNKLELDLTSKDGLYKVNQLKLNKAQARITAEGTFKPDADIDLSVTGKSIQLEDSDNFNRLGLNIASKLDFKGLIRGPIGHPNISVSSDFTNTFIADQPKEDSHIDIDYFNKTIHSNFNFTNKTLVGKLSYPLFEESNIKGQFSFNNFDFTDTFTSLSKNSQDHSLDSSVNAKLKIDIPQSDFDKLDANLKISKFKIRRGSSSMTAPLPMEIEINKGQIKTRNCEVHGDGTFARLTSKNASLANLNLYVNGKINLALAIFALPMFEDIRGKASFSTQIQGSYDKPKLLGSSYLQKAYIKIFDFPHPLEDISSDAIFNENNFVINTFKAQIAGGRATANGSVALNGYKDLPINITAQVTDANLKVPQGVVTKGKANLQISGKWLPYKLTGDYLVTSGSVKKNLLTSSESLKTVKASSYLPKTKKSVQESPLDLDIDVKVLNYIPVGILIPNGEVNLQANGNVKAKGSISKPLLNGRVNIKPQGEILFQENKYLVQSGFITYKNSPPEKPDLQINVESRIQDYDISVLTQGDPENIEFEFSSQPSLNREEIISLLLFGQTTTDIEENFNRESNAAQTGIQIGTALISQGLGLTRDINKKLPFEIDIGTTVNDGVTIPTFTIKRQFTPKFGITGSQSIGSTNQAESRAEYRFNSELSAVGLYQNRGDTGADGTRANLFNQTYGIDLEYKFNFK